MRDITETMSFKSDDLKRDNIKHVLRLVKEALDERGYNARTIIQSVERYEIIEELVRAYLEEDK